MRDQEQLRKIEALGTEEPPESLPPPHRERAGLPLWQAVFCLLLLLSLAGLRLAKEELFYRVRDWYRQESVRQIELPSLARPTPQPTQAPPEQKELLGELRQV